VFSGEAQAGEKKDDHQTPGMRSEPGLPECHGVLIIGCVP
jgi:hypothetical protein